ncbi:MAG TPA: hypothetical protein V6D17_08960 [Candidatus Obscuribacterales bacterium]
MHSHFGNNQAGASTEIGVNLQSPVQTSAAQVVNDAKGIDKSRASNATCSEVVPITVSSSVDRSSRGRMRVGAPHEETISLSSPSPGYLITFSLSAIAVVASVLADRIFLTQALSWLVLWGPFGQNLGMSSALLIVPWIVGTLWAALLVKRSNQENLLLWTCLARGTLALSCLVFLPAIMGLPCKDLLVGSVIAALSLFGSLFWTMRPALMPPAILKCFAGQSSEVQKQLSAFHAANWAGCATATLAALVLPIPAMDGSAMALMRLASILYVICFLFSALAVGYGQDKREEIFARGEKAAAFLGSLKSAANTQNGKEQEESTASISVVTAAQTLIVSFYTTLVFLALQAHHLSAAIAHELIPSLTFGIVAGAVLSRSMIGWFGCQRVLTASTIFTVGVLLSCAVVVNFMFAKLCLFFLGAAGSFILTAGDTALNMRRADDLAKTFGLKEALVFAGVLPVSLYLEKVLPAVSLLPMFKLTAILALAAAGILAIALNQPVVALFGRMATAYRHFPGKHDAKERSVNQSD